MAVPIPPASSCSGRASGFPPDDPGLLAAVLEQAPEGMAMVGSTGLLFANRAWRALAGDGACAPDSLLIPDDAERLRAVIADVRGGSGPGTVAVAEASRGTDGARRFFDLRATAMEGFRGVVLLTAHDVTAVVQALDRKETLLREVNHRVKNSFQLVSSLMTIQAMATPDPQIREKFQDACGRIGTVARVHQRLDRGGRVDAVAFGHYLRDLAEELTRTLPPRSGVTAVRVDADDQDVSADVAVSLALVVNELVTNAVRHAYRLDDPGVVTVRFQVLDDGRRRLSVADSGRGLASDFDAARSDTMGMKIVRALTAQLRGRLSTRPGEPGAVFQVDLPA